MKKAGRVVGGKTAPAPITWQVVVLINNEFRCGGTILDEETILSAAHCFNPLSPVDDHDFIEAGIILRHSKSRKKFLGQKRFIKRIISHPSFNSEMLDNDIAILTLMRPLSFNEDVQPALLPDHSFRPEEAGETAIVSGWGKTSNGNTRGNSLLES